MARRKDEGNAIEVRGLRRSFGEVTALRGLSFSVAKGTFLAIFGPNGAGKTTLLKILTTLIAPSAGVVEIMGFGRPRDDLEIRRRVGFLSHVSCLYGDLTVEENLHFYGKLYHLSHRIERVAEVMELFSIEARRGQAVRTLSRGYQQRVALARALLHDPPILLLDEPFTGLDPDSRDRLAELLGRMHRERGKTVVMITHEMHLGHALAQEMMIQHRGRIVGIYRRSACPFEEFLAHYREGTR